MTGPEAAGPAGRDALVRREAVGSNRQVTALGRSRARGGLAARAAEAADATEGGAVDPGGQMDMQQLLAAAQQMQNQLMNAQRELADTRIEGSAGAGLVTAVVNGQGELVDVTISPRAIDPADLAESAQTVADLVLAAVRDAYRLAGELQEEKMNPLAAGLGGGEQPGIPGLGGLFGGEAGGTPRQPGEPGQDDGPGWQPPGGPAPQ